MTTVHDGAYNIELPMNGGCITDMGTGNFLNLLKPGAEERAQKVCPAFGPCLDLILLNPAPKDQR
jgi:hypothetical protein